MGIFGFGFLIKESEEMITLLAKEMKLPRELVEAKFIDMLYELKKFQKIETKVVSEEE